MEEVFSSTIVSDDVNLLFIDVETRTPPSQFKVGNSGKPFPACLSKEGMFFGSVLFDAFPP